MSQPPLVSIIMPVYNGEAFLKEAIDSVLSQTYTNWELIVMNDGSTDGSRDVVLSYTDPRIILVDNECNLGIIETKNRAIDRSRGKYIASLDADDIALPTRIEKQVNFLEKHEECGLCATLHQEIDGNGVPGKKSIFPTSNRDVHTYLLVANCICHSATMLRASLMKQLKYNPAFPIAEDYELWDRITHTHFVASIPEVLTYYRVHGNNISITKKGKMFNTVRQLAARMLTTASVKFTERELMLHSDLISFTNQLTGTLKDFKEMERWVLSLLSQVRGKEEYNHKVMYRLMTDRYIVACVRNKRFFRMLMNPLMRLHPLNYLGILATKMSGKDVPFQQKEEEYA